MPADFAPPPNLHATATPWQLHQQGEHADPRAWRSYVVRPGDSLAKLAVRHRTTIAALVARNGLDDPRQLEIGRTLSVPGAAPTRSNAGAVSGRTDQGSVQPVRSTDTTRTATPSGAEHQAAGADTDKATPVTAGAVKAQRPAPRTVITLRVERGDSVHAMAARYGASPGAILKANRMSDPDSLVVGALVRVPVPATPAARAQEAPAAVAAGPSTAAGRTYPPEVVAAADRTRAALRHTAVPSRSETRALIVRTAQRYGVNPRLALAVAWQESGWNQRAVSPAHAIGVMQVLPSTGDWAGRMIGQDLDLRSAPDNVTAGVVMLRWLTTHAEGLDQAIAGYYQGLAGVRTNGMYPDTKDYVASVKAHVARF